MAPLALSNLATVYLDKRQYTRAEKQFRDVVQRFTQSLSPDHLYTGIAQIKLGRALTRQRRYAEAEEHTLAGYQIVAKQSNPSLTWSRTAREDLATIYDALNQPAKAAAYRSQPAALRISHSLSPALTSLR